ncbi:MAG TPA: hypothetical protein VGL40_08470 [Bacillota bacterium]
MKLAEALDKALAADPPQHSKAVSLLEQMLAHPEAEDAYDVPQLLGLLAQCYTAMGHFKAAIKTVKRMLARRLDGQPDGRHLIAEILVKAGRVDEAEKLYMKIAGDAAPGDAAVHEAAGWAYHSVGDAPKALYWATAGLEVALRGGDPGRRVERLAALREKLIDTLGVDPDDLQARAGRFLADDQAGLHEAKRRKGRAVSAKKKPRVHGWFAVRVQLVGGGDMGRLSSGPGRVFLVGPEHTLKDLAVAIDLAFARWDLAHMHEFRFPDGRCYGIPDDEPGGPLFGGEPTIDYERHRVGAVVRQGEDFIYVFDFGADWQHRCQVTRDGLNPEEVAGIVPRNPVPIWGWGSMPDQYGRRWEGDTGEGEGEDDDDESEDDR